MGVTRACSPSFFNVTSAFTESRILPLRFTLRPGATAIRAIPSGNATSVEEDVDPAAVVASGWNASFPPPNICPPTTSSRQGRLGRRLELESRRVLHLVSRGDVGAGSRVGGNAYAVAPVLVPGVGVRTKPPLSARRDERQHRAGHAQPAKTLGRAGRKSQRGHHGQPSGIRLTRSERIKTVLDQSRDVAESRGLSVARGVQ